MAEFRFVRDIPAIPGAEGVFLVKGDCRSAAETILPEAEARRAAGMSSESAREAFLAGRRIVRRVLGEMLSLAPESVPIVLEERGRPVLEGGCGLFFSISHSGNAVMAAFSREPLGIDVEGERPLDAVGLSRRFFSREEADAVERDPALFLPLWTAREAAMKGDGRGMAALLGITSGIPSPAGFTVRIGDVIWETCFWREAGIVASLAVRRLPEVILWSDPLQLVG